MYLQLRNSGGGVGGAFGGAFRGPGGSASKRSRAHEEEASAWFPRTVEIVGLPPGWRAHVSARYGNVVFEHVESGYTQRHVPPGFADAPDGLASAASMESTDAGDGGESDGDSGSMMAATVAPSAMGTAMEASQTGCDAVPAPAVLIAPAAAPPTAVPAGFAFAGTFLNARVATSRPCRV